jgi:hypothetical protein
MQLEKEIAGVIAATLSQDLAQFWMIRRDRVYVKGLGSCSEEYENAEREAHTIYEALKNILAEDQRKQLVSLMDYKSSMEIASNSLFFQHGFRDGIRMLLQTIID